jgi:Flp pilus assembly pilin Flp
MSRRRGEDGASAVEAALVTPVIIVLLVAVVEFSMYFKDNLSAADAAKAGVRVSSALGRNSTFAQAAADRVQQMAGALDKNGIEQLWIYKANVGDEYPVGYSSFANCTTCVKFDWNGTEFVPSSTNWASTTQIACAGSDGPPDRVGVYLRVRHDSITRLFFDSITIDEADVVRFEPIPTLNGCR